MVNIDALKFQQLNLDGLKTLVSWAQQEGWNPGINDAEIFYATDPQGFYGYFHNGELIAGGSVVAYGNDFGFMGFFIVQPQYRALGIGRKLWYQRRDILLSRLNTRAAIGMDGVVAMQRFYKKGGFEIAFRDERYEKKGEPFPVHPSISSIRDEDFASILEYDQQCFGFARPQFMKPWLAQPQVRAFKFTEHDSLKGFAVLRKAQKGYKICPLFADNAVVAEQLYKACLNAGVSQPVYIDIPVANADAAALVKKHDAAYVFECARMYYGSPPGMNIQKVFGITTFELG